MTFGYLPLLRLLGANHILFQYQNQDGWLVCWGLTALLTQNRSYRACRFVGPKPGKDSTKQKSIEPPLYSSYQPCLQSHGTYAISITDSSGICSGIWHLERNTLITPIQTGFHKVAVLQTNWYTLGIIL